MVNCWVWVGGLDFFGIPLSKNPRFIFGELKESSHPPMNHKLIQTAAETQELQKLKEQQVHELQAAKDQCDVLRKRKTKLKDELIFGWELG